MERTFIELFCGHAEVSRAFQQKGFKIISIDKRKRKGVCEPTHRQDILTMRPQEIFTGRPFALWASPVCTAFSFGAGDYYFYKNGLPKETAPPYIKLLFKALDAIEFWKPQYFFIENPRGRMRYQKGMIDFLARNNGTIKTISLASYGFPTIKPTDIFTNAYDWEPVPFDGYLRGKKNPNGFKFKNLTLASKQSTPLKLAEEIAAYCFAKSTDR